MSLGPNKAGDLVEAAAADRFRLAPAADDDPDWFDARTPAGLPVETKGARYRVGDGAESRYGRWWVQQGNHLRLVEAGGLYALIVYEPVDGGADDEPAIETVYAALVPAKFVSAVMGAWHPTGEGHTGGADVTAQVRWTKLFPRSRPHRDGGPAGGSEERAGDRVAADGGEQA